MGFVYSVLWILKALWTVLSKTINVFEKFATTKKKKKNQDALENFTMYIGLSK